MKELIEKYQRDIETARIQKKWPETKLQPIQEAMDSAIEHYKVSLTTELTPPEKKCLEEKKDSLPSIATKYKSKTALTKDERELIRIFQQYKHHQASQQKHKQHMQRVIRLWKVLQSQPHQAAVEASVAEQLHQLSMHRRQPSEAHLAASPTIAHPNP